MEEEAQDVEVRTEDVEEPAEWEDEEGGGPVKTFLEHLEDLRWTLIKCIASVIISMVFCLVASNKLVDFLTWPLKLANNKRVPTEEVVQVFMGDERFGKMPAALFGELPPTTNKVHRFNVVPGEPNGDGTWPFLLELDPNPIEIIPIWEGGVELKNYRPVGAFIVAFQLMLYGGLVVASPLVIFFIGQFVLPALRIHEKKFLYQTAGFGAFLFILGVVFCYIIIMQIALIATVQFSEWMGFTSDEWRAEDYVSFVCKLMLASGVSFQLPVVLLTLVKIGLLDNEKLRRFRPYWIVVNLAICAIVTPTGDPFTMVLMALPLQFLYELSVFISKFWEAKENQLVPQKRP